MSGGDVRIFRGARRHRGREMPGGLCHRAPLPGIEVRQTAPYLELLRAVCVRQAELVARWMHVGFIHGVMNTDNMSVSGETIDYGPCAFMDTYDPATVFSSIDSHGPLCVRESAARGAMESCAIRRDAVVAHRCGSRPCGRGGRRDRGTILRGFRGALALRAARKTGIAD